MKALVVGISDCQVSADRDSELVTYALGSCIAVSVWDPLRRIAGMLHFMLPESSLDAHKAETNPCMFADTGIESLFKVAAEKGADRRRLVVRLAGGAQVLDPAGRVQHRQAQLPGGAEGAVEAWRPHRFRSCRGRCFAHHPAERGGREITGTRGQWHGNRAPAARAIEKGGRTWHTESCW